MQKIEEEARKYMQDKLFIDDVITPDLYEKLAGWTAIFPKDKALEYLALGMTSEAGEVAGKVKKLAIASEIGDVLWYCAMMAKEVGVPLNTIMQENLRKLHDRKERGKLHGSGDDR